MISGLSMGVEGAIDNDGIFLVTGGELITAGSIESMSSDSTQPLIYVSYTIHLLANSLIEIKDADGKVLLEYTSLTAASMSGFSSPLFKIGETYTLFVNGEKISEITLNEMTTTISDDGGAFNAGVGVGRIDGMGGQNTRPGKMPNLSGGFNATTFWFKIGIDDA